MTDRKRVFLIIFIGFVIFITITSILVTSDNKRSDLVFKKNKEYIGKLQFKGKVINSKVYQYGGKPYLMICVKLDFSNVQKFEIINEYCFLKIKDSIATMGDGFFDKEIGAPRYIEVNMGNSGIEREFMANGDTTSDRFYLPNWGLSRNDLNLCN